LSSIGNQSPVERELVHRLALFLKANMPSLKEALEEWPDTNVQLNMPSISIMTKKTTFTPFQPEVYNNPATPNEPVDQPRQTCDMLIGEYDQPMQLDLWTANKEDRSQLMDQFFKAFASLSPDKPNGVSLQLPNYYNVWSRFDLDTYDYLDDEASVQRSERRATISVLSNCPAIRTQVLPVIKTIVVQPQIVDNISDDS
jgi:hypothetical protein